jgi:hypothetical protein
MSVDKSTLAEDVASYEAVVAGRALTPVPFEFSKAPSIGPGAVEARALARKEPRGVRRPL